MKDVFWYKEFSNLKMNPKLMEDFENLKLISYKDIVNNADQIFAFYNYVLDFNYVASLKNIRQNQYLEKFTKRIEETFKDEEIIQNANKLLKICNEFIDKKIEDN